jgi:hypothetical protein
MNGYIDVFLSGSSQGLRRIATDKLEQESLQYRSEIQQLSDQLELALRLNSSDFSSNMYDWTYYL